MDRYLVDHGQPTRSTLNVDGNRQSAAERAIERLNGMDTQKLRQEATEEISGNN